MHHNHQRTFDDNDICVLSFLACLRLTQYLAPCSAFLEERVLGWCIIFSPPMVYLHFHEPHFHCSSLLTLVAISSSPGLYLLRKCPNGITYSFKWAESLRGSRSLPQCNRSGLQYYLSRHLLGWHGMKRLSCSFNTGTTRRVIESTKFWMLWILVPNNFCKRALSCRINVILGQISLLAWLSSFLSSI